MNHVTRLCMVLLVAVCAALVVAVEMTVLHQKADRAMTKLWEDVRR